MIPTMENKPLFIPKSKQWKGLVVYCYRCKTNVKDICKETGKPLKQCKHGERHVFKVYVSVPGTKNMRRTKKLETRDIDEAIKQAIEFEKEVKSGACKAVENFEKNSEVLKESKNLNKPELLIHALARYIGWLHNENVPAHKIKERSDEHIKDVERALKCLGSCLKENGYNIEKTSVKDIDDEMVGIIYNYLIKRKFANRTFNKYFGYYTSFMKWYSDEYDLNTRNYFKKVKRKRLNPDPEVITNKEYLSLLEIITPENGIKEYKKGIKPIRSLYRPWLKDAFKLALETGRRREEVINLKWKDIIESSGILYIETEDYKVNRIQNRITEEEKKYNYIPVTSSLTILLDELGYNVYKKTDKFILAPEIKNKRNKIMSDTLSRGFSHFYSQLNTGRQLTFKCLRKTYITSLEIFMGNGNTKAITGHSDDKVIEKYYVDKREIAKASRGFNVFATEANRNDDLKELRANTNPKNQNQKLEV